MIAAGAGADVGGATLLMVTPEREDPLKTQSVALVSSWLGKMSMYNCAWICSKGTKSGKRQHDQRRYKTTTIASMPDFRQFLTS